jgi:hypothetical protein
VLHVILLKLLSDLTLRDFLVLSRDLYLFFLKNAIIQTDENTGKDRIASHPAQFVMFLPSLLVICPKGMTLTFREDAWWDKASAQLSREGELDRLFQGRLTTGKVASPLSSL